MKCRPLVFRAILGVVAIMLANWGGATVTLAPPPTQPNRSGLVAVGAKALLKVMKGEPDE